MKRLGVFMIAVALIAGIVSCVGGDGNGNGGSYTLIVDFTDGGTVTVDDVPIPGKAILTYNAGTIVSLNATPSAGYRFVEWTGNVSTIADVSSASTTITTDRDCSITAIFEEDEVVTFVDSNLEATIRETIGVPERPIYTRDMEGLSKLDASQRGISDLTGLEYACKLTALELEYNLVSDISPLANLTSLRYLLLGYNQISDISPLVHNDGLSEGDEVYLQENPLNSDSINVYIPQLEARGVYVAY